MRDGERRAGRRSDERRDRRSPKRWRAVAVVCVTACVVAGCQDWTQYMGNAPLNGVAPAQGLTTANVASLTPSFTVSPPGGGGVTDPALTVSNGKIFGADRAGLFVADANGSTNCGVPTGICLPLWTGLYPHWDDFIFVPSQPLVSHDTVFVSTSSSHGNGQLFAFDANGTTGCGGSPTTCQPLWTATVDSRSGPNVDGDRLFITDEGRQLLEAFDATGQVGCAGVPKTCQPLWTAPITSMSTPAIAGGRVYVTSSSDAAPTMSVYDEAGSLDCTGSPVVCEPVFTGVLPGPSSGSVDVSGGVAYLETAFPAQLVAFDAGGSTGCGGGTVCQPLWSAMLKGQTTHAYMNTPAVANGKVYASSFDPEDGHLGVYDASGSQNCAGSPRTCTPLWSGEGNRSYQGASPLLTGGLAFVGDDAWDATGVEGCTVTAGTTTCVPVWRSPFQFAPNEEETVTISGGKAFQVHGNFGEPTVLTLG